MKRTATAVWNGTTKEGKGTLTTQSGVLSKTQYSYSSRFERGIGTNPEELIAAAHAGCFSMALSGTLKEIGFAAEAIETTATVTMEKLEAGPTVTEVHLDVTANVANMDAEAFEVAAADAKANCPVSRLLNTKITLSAKLMARIHSVSL